MAKKKIKKPSTKKKKSSPKKNIVREKVIGEPTPVIPSTQDAAKQALQKIYTNRDVDIYPRIIFNETWWTKFKRFIGLIP